MLINTIMLLLLEKSAEIVLGLLLEKVWKWILSDRNLKHLLDSLKLSLLVLYLDWVLPHLPHPEVSHYEFWEFSEIGLAIASPISDFCV